MKEFLKELDIRITLKSNISDVYSHKRTKIKTNSDDELPPPKIWNMHNVVIVIKSIYVFDKKFFYLLSLLLNYYYLVFLEKCSYN